MKKTWDEKFRIWIDRIYPGWVKLDDAIPLWVINDAYTIGRKHQRKVCNENTVRLKAFLKETLESSDALTVSSNRLGAENRALKMERHSLLIDLNIAGNYRRSLIGEIHELEARLLRNGGSSGGKHESSMYRL